MATGHSGQCKSCSQPNTIAFRGVRAPKPAIDPASVEVLHEQTMTALAGFLARRHSRKAAALGVAPTLSLVPGQKPATPQAAEASELRKTA